MKSKQKIIIMVGMFELEFSIEYTKLDLLTDKLKLFP